MTIEFGERLHYNREPTLEMSDIDLFVSALGYEPRCVHAFSTLRPAPNKTLALAFPDRHVGRFEANSLLFREAETFVAEVEDEEVGALFRSRLDALNDEPTVRIGVDVSSFSRSRTASIVDEVFDFALTRSVDLRLLYSPAAFAAPRPPVSPLQILEPLSDSFAGLQADPELPLVALVGVGYEEQRALGVIEFLEASDAWILVPTGFDSRFDAAVESSNRLLLRRMPERRIDYDPSGEGAFHAVRSLAHSLRSDYRVVMVPMGPKLHAAACMMVSLLSDDVDAVWRASSGTLEPAQESEAAGPIVSLRFVTSDLSLTAQTSAALAGAK